MDGALGAPGFGHCGKVVGKFAFGFVKTSENPGIGRAVFHTGGHKALVDAVQTQITLVGFIVESWVMKPGVIGAGINAGAVAVAFLPVREHNACGVDKGGACGAGLNTGRRIAVPADICFKIQGRIGKGSGFLVRNPGVETAFDGMVLQLAGHHARLAARTAGRVNDHAPFSGVTGREGVSPACGHHSCAGPQAEYQPVFNKLSSVFHGKFSIPINRSDFFKKRPGSLAAPGP